MSKSVLEVEAAAARDDDVVGAEPETAADTTQPDSSQGKRLSISVRSLAYSAVVAVLIVAVAVLAWLYIGVSGKLAAEQAAAADQQRAKEVALTYAVNAAQMNFRDFG